MELPPELADRPFSVADGVAAGISAERLKNRALVRPFWGIRSSTEALTLAARARAFVPRMPDRAFFVAATAAALHGLPLPDRVGSGPVDVGVLPGSRRVDAAGIRAHQAAVDPLDLVELGGTRMTAIDRTWIDLAASGALTLAELVAVGDAMLWRRDSRTSLDRIAAAAARSRGRRGVSVLRLAVPLLSDRADSAAESLVRIAIWEHGLPTPLVNRRVVAANGRFLGTPDLSWPDQRVLLEYEGDHHRTDRRQWHSDVERYAAFQDERWTVVRATAPDLRDSRAMIARLTRLLGG